MSTDEILLRDFKPRPQLITEAHIPARPRFPVIDAHIHLGPTFGGNWIERPLEALLEVMEETGVEMMVDLDGGWGEEILEMHLAHFKCKAPERFIHFGGVSWKEWPRYGDRFGEWAAGRLREQIARGAQGLKIWKPLGLHVYDQHAKLVPVDDLRLDPLWATAGELSVPVMIHVADPVAFFEPLSPANERWEELHRKPEWQFPSPQFPPFLTLMEGLSNLVTRHPKTVFIGAHVGCFAENLNWVGELLEHCPNLYIDFSARIGELGRQPYAARRFFLRYADRILFGTDSKAQPDLYRLYYRFLETDDEYFDYSLEEIPPQGRWRIYGLYLPDDVLEKVYYLNARRMFGLGSKGTTGS